jgi:nitronate monooxygenase
VIELEVPVVLAPLAGGPFTPELAAAVSNAGGLGFVAGGYLSAESLADRLRQTRTLTSGPIGVNLFVLQPSPVDEDAVSRYGNELAPEAERYGVELGDPRFEDDDFAAKLDLVVSERVQVVSTTFGPPPAELVDRVHGAGGEVWATVTSNTEARTACAAGADALVVQGAEAGGHRGSFIDDDEPGEPLLELVHHIDASVPLIATGGIADARDARAACEAGATAVQAGTAFLLCPEAGTSGAHRQAIAAGGTTALTRAFTGRQARGILNEFMRDHPDAPSAYPQVHHLTAPLRAAARAAGDAERINLWAGTEFSRTRALPARGVVAQLRP